VFRERIAQEHNVMLVRIVSGVSFIGLGLGLGLELGLRLILSLVSLFVLVRVLVMLLVTFLQVLLKRESLRGRIV
jgi:hypothetical protein